MITTWEATAMSSSLELLMCEQHTWPCGAGSVTQNLIGLQIATQLELGVCVYLSARTFG